METREHPSHHRFLKLINLIMLAVGVGVFFAVQHFAPGLSRGAVIGIAVGSALPIVVLFSYLHMRSCTCPGCGQRLPRDPSAKRRAYDYTCTGCGVRWVVIKNISRLKKH